MNYSAVPGEMFASMWRNRSLIRALVVRDVLGRYKGAMFGVLWSLFNPMLMLAVYTFVFSEIFKARWSVNSESKTEFALVLFAGLMMFNLFAECINRAPGLILANVNYVKKVVFPLEILPGVATVSALFHWLISLGVWFATYLVLFGIPHATALYLPLVIIPFLLFTLGLSWMLASLGVFLRDVAQFIGIVTTILMFLSPIFYPATALPDSYRHLLYLNPLTPVIEMTRDVLYWGKSPDEITLGIIWTVGGLMAWLGFAWFQKTRKGFSDVI